jgi:hypothetical protein
MNFVYFNGTYFHMPYFYFYYIFCVDPKLLILNNNNNNNNNNNDSKITGLRFLLMVEKFSYWQNFETIPTVV